MGVHLLHGDCLEHMRTLEDNSVDAIVTDPPAGIGFMGKEWDDFRRARNPNDAGRDNVFGRTSQHGPEYGRRPREMFIAFLTAVMTEALRVIKPGGHAFVWALPRTSHWTMTAIEDAGWEVRDVVTHLFSSGFPKSKSMRDIGRPELGTALKPAAEFWILCRKPLAAPSVAANVVTYGTGAVNIDACRIPSAGDYGRSAARADGTVNKGEFFSGLRSGEGLNDYASPAGRWPANVILSHHEACEQVGTKRVKGGKGTPPTVPNNPIRFQASAAVHHIGYADADGYEELLAFRCVEECPVAMLDAQAGERKSGGAGVSRAFDSGYNGGWPERPVQPYADTTTNASRFYKVFGPEPTRAIYIPKASRRDRTANCTIVNTHPTCKSTALMKYLCALITPPGGVILDMFLGSGSTGVAAVELGFDFIGIEQDEEYFKTAQERIAAAVEPPLLQLALEEAVLI